LVDGDTGDNEGHPEDFDRFRDLGQHDDADDGGGSWQEGYQQ
jgi:hypothetical protein